jgi:hypothetical protein
MSVVGEHEIDPQRRSTESTSPASSGWLRSSSRARDRHQVVVTGEDAQVGSARESLLDPRLVLATDLALVDVRLGRVHRHERDIGTAAFRRSRMSMAPKIRPDWR